MTRKIAAGFIGFVAILLLVTPHASAVSIITDKQIQAIKTNCTQIQASLNQLQRNDTLLRHNRGAAFRTIADKLMVPLNQRIASNQLAGSKLVEITADYNKSYEDFRLGFIAYDTALSTALNTDCQKQPTTFFDALDLARQKRLALYKASDKLTKLAEQYKAEFLNFKKNYAEELKK
ncbi:MAG TPA: hypothetical protein VGE34_03660 [Candidatus Saccharimonadales bacterium]